MTEVYSISTQIFMLNEVQKVDAFTWYLYSVILLIASKILQIKWSRDDHAEYKILSITRSSQHQRPRY